LHLRLQLFMSWVMDDLPVDLIWIKDDVYSEDWYKLLSLSVTNNLPAQIT
jgi:hypothetical protein